MFGVIAIVFILMYLNEMYKNRRLEGKINELEDRRVRDIKERIDREDRVMRELEKLHKHYKKTYETSDLDYNKGFYW